MAITLQYGALYCCLLFFYIPAHAQYQVQHFTTENGLPSNGIKGMQWDETTGFLWIATEAGLVRYNGMSFKTFDVASNPELGSNRILMLVKNTAGKILAGGEEGNLTLIKKNTATLYFEGAKEAKYVYNHYSAVTVSDTLFRQCVKNPWDARYNFYNTVVASFSDTACTALTTGQLYYYSISTKQPDSIKALPAGIKNIFKISNQLYYLDSRNRMFALDVYHHLTQEQDLQDDNGNEFVIKEKDSKLFWKEGMEYPVLLQKGKAWIIEKESNRKIIFRMIASGIPENALFNCVQYKKRGNYLFLGTDSKGIYVIHQNQLVTKKPDEININQKNSFYGQIELPDGNIITSEGRIIGDKLPGNNFNIGPRFLNHVFLLNDSVLLFCQMDSMFLYNRFTFEKKLMFLIDTYEDFSFAISGGQLYFESRKGIAVVKNNKEIDFIYKFDEKIAAILRPFTMMEIAPGKLAVASCQGLLQFDIKTKKLDTLLKIPSVCIRNLYKEGDYVFIGTYGGGFYVMKDGKLKAMPLDINQYLKYTHCFIKDKEGFCWISTNNGLFKTKMSDITDAYDKDLKQVYYHYMGKDDGMETTEMNGGCTPCALRLRNDNFSFPTMDGMLWFNPEKVNITLPDGDIYIDKIIVNDTQQYVMNNGVIQLPEFAKKMDISLAIDAWCKKQNLYIDYKLNDDVWQQVDMASDIPVISASNITYGKYMLQIRKMNGFGANNYSYATIAFTVATPFYHQWWFRILAVLAFAGAGYLIFRLRLRQYDVKEKKLSAMVEQKTMDLNLKNIELEKNDQIKTRLISVINHDIITPLKFMHYAGKALVQNKGMIDREQELETISDITQTAGDMEMLSSQILNWIIYQNPNERMQKEEFDLQQLVEMVFGVLQFPAKHKNTLLQNEVPVHFVVYQYMDPLRVLIYNLVLNAVNFTKEGRVSVQSSFKENQVIIKITDTGLGMTLEQIHNLMSDERIIASANVDNKKGTGLGYMIIKDLLKIMGGSLFVESSKNSGTTVSVSLPGAVML